MCAAFGVCFPQAESAAKGVLTVISPGHPLHSYKFKQLIEGGLFFRRVAGDAGPLVGYLPVELTDRSFMLLKVAEHIVNDVDSPEGHGDSILRGLPDSHGIAVVMGEDDFRLVELRQVVDVVLGACAYRALHAGVEEHRAGKVIASPTRVSPANILLWVIPGIGVTHDAEI